VTPWIEEHVLYSRPSSQTTAIDELEAFAVIGVFGVFGVKEVPQRSSLLPPGRGDQLVVMAQCSALRCRSWRKGFLPHW
jgi:hypothetical protein